MTRVRAWRWFVIGAVALTSAIAAQGKVAQEEPSALAPARNGLRPVPTPRLDDLEPAVARQIRDERQSFESLVGGRSLSGGRLADAYGSAGRLFHAYEFFESAEAAYLNASRLSSGNATWPHLLGYLYQQTGRLEEAAEQFLEARRLRPDDRAATVRLGQIYLGLNRLPEARAEFERVVAVFPALARNGLGEVALRERRYNEAIGHFRAALERVPQATSIHYSIAMAYRGLGRLDDARTHLQRRGDGGIDVGDPIVDDLQTLIRGERGLVVRGRRAYEAGRYEEAAAAFAKALEAAPASVTARVNLGLALSQLGNPDGAAEQFENALRLEADNRIAHASLGILRARQGRDPEALGHLRAAFTLAPEDPTVSRELIAVLLRLQRDDEAIDVLTRARSFAPDNEDTLIGLSILLAGRERFREALGLLDDAHRQFPERTATTTTLARLLASSPDRSIRDGRRALELSQTVYASEPAPAHAETVALALAELGRCGEAAEWMRRGIAAAERLKDTTETARLTRELEQYGHDPCRP